jgi:hypothetical protein
VAKKPAATSAEPEPTVLNLTVMKKPSRAGDAALIKRPSCADAVDKSALSPEAAVVPKQRMMKKPAAASSKATNWPSAWHNSGESASSKSPVACKRPAMAPAPVGSPPSKKAASGAKGASGARWVGFREYGAGTPPKDEGGTDPVGEDGGKEDEGDGDRRFIDEAGGDVAGEKQFLLKSNLITNGP